MDYIGIIPARYQSSRLPGKPLAMINGKTMIERVVAQSLKCTALNRVIVATDSEQIFNFLLKKEIEVVLTSDTHQSGTDRCFEAANKINAKKDDVIINIQGDEPFIKPTQIELVVNSFLSSSAQIVTLVKQIESLTELENPSIPKVVFDKNNRALLFSRAIIPFLREENNKAEWLKGHNYFKHIGIYGYRFSVLSKLVELPVSLLEKAEGLEQLRWLENAYAIQVCLTDIESFAVDTPNDLEKANQYATTNNIN